MNRPRNRQRRSNGPQRPQTASATVPTVEQVVPGATVSIVLKEDQTSGRQTTGTVQEVLTRGNHPRGIKVRLRDGRIGRVQRMGIFAGGQPTEAERAVPRDRTLADFLPASPPPPPPPSTVVACPVCNAFEGDEAAVTHHIERDHFS